MASTPRIVNDRRQEPHQNFELDVRNPLSEPVSPTTRPQRPRRVPSTQHPLPQNDRASPNSDSSSPSQLTATSSNVPTTPTTNPSSTSTPPQNDPFLPSIAPQSTSGSDQLLLPHIMPPRQDWPQNRILTLTAAIATIAAAFFGLIQLGFQIWQTINQNNQPPPNSTPSYSEDVQWGVTFPSTSPSDGPPTSKPPSDPDTHSSQTTLTTTALILIILLAFLALTLSLYVLFIVLRHRHSEAGRRASDFARRASDYATPAMATSALNRIHQHTKAHARYAQDVVRSYHVRLQEIGAEHWRYWATPVQTVEMLRRRMEEEDWEIRTLLMRENGRDEEEEEGGWGGNIAMETAEEVAEEADGCTLHDRPPEEEGVVDKGYLHEGDDEDTGAEFSVPFESRENAGVQRLVAWEEGDEEASWTGEIFRREDEEESEEQLSPLEFQKVNTHVTAKTAMDLGQDELRRRFHENERLHREREAEEFD